MATKAKYGWTTPQQMQTQKDRVKYAGGDKSANPSQIAALKETAALNNRNTRAAQLAKDRSHATTVMSEKMGQAKNLRDSQTSQAKDTARLAKIQANAKMQEKRSVMPSRLMGGMAGLGTVARKTNLAPSFKSGPMKMAKGGVAASKMGAVKTASPSRDGIASKGKTKGTNLGNSGKNVGIMRGARRTK